MKNILIGIATAASALTFAAPASAQWAPPVYRYQPYNYVGFNNRSFGQAMEVRVQRIRTDIRMMEARRVLAPAEARSLEQQARNLQVRIYRASRNGIQPNEARRVEMQLRNLEMRVQREATDWNNRPNRRHRY